MKDLKMFSTRRILKLELESGKILFMCEEKKWWDFLGLNWTPISYDKNNCIFETYQEALDCLNKKRSTKIKKVTHMRYE